MNETIKKKQESGCHKVISEGSQQILEYLLTIFFFTLGNSYADICFNILSYTFMSGVIFCKCVTLSNEKLNIGITYLKLQAYEIQIQHSSLLNRTELQCKYKIDQVHNIIIFFIPFLYNDLFQNLISL